ncbi:MAG: hypothetical protein JWO65_1922 [Sphingomonas bacterium]|nr:hypothetical protein [Sphingomonas bacterium]
MDPQSGLSQGSPGEVGCLLARCRTKARAYSPREMEFLRSACGWRRPPSEAQARWLLALADREILDPAAMRRLVDEAKARHNLSDIIGRATVLRRRGAREMVGLCPFHKERSPSFEVNDAKGLYHCHGCGAAGDAMTWLTKGEGLSFQAAFHALAGNDFPEVSSEDRVQRATEDEASREAAIAEARSFWIGATDPYGTPAETYLRGRGISSTIPPSFRFGMVPAGKDENDRWKRPLPALIGAVTKGDELTGIQRIFLTDDGQGKRWGKKSKLTLGRFVGGAVKMGNRRSDPVEVIVTEGPEDALSLAQELPDQEVWAALGTANIAMLTFPASVKAVVIASQNDAAGERATAAAASAMIERGLSVRLMRPDTAFKDWNDQLRGVRR